MSAPDPHAPPPTQWTSTAYQTSAAFVPQLTTKLLQLISPQPQDRVLDVGCGDGKFTSKYLPLVSSVYGVDASASFVETANAEYGAGSAFAEGLKGKEGGRFEAKVVDCRFLEREDVVQRGGFDKVVSNAALHWILRDEKTRVGTLKGCRMALKPGGWFVFEMGGAGNVAELQVAFVAALVRHVGMRPTEAQAVSPWFFPDVKEMTALLMEAGFVVEEGDMELEYRPTTTEVGSDGRPNIEGWVRLMGKQFLDVAEKAEKLEEVVRDVCEIVGAHGICGRADGSAQMGYVRLRGKVRRPE